MYILHLLANAVIVRLYAKKLLVLHIDDDESELHASKSISDAQVTRVWCEKKWLIIALLNQPT